MYGVSAGQSAGRPSLRLIWAVLRAVVPRVTTSRRTADLRRATFRRTPALRRATLRRATLPLRVARRTVLRVFLTADLTFLTVRRRARLADFLVAMMRYLLGESASLAPGDRARYLDCP